MSKNSLKNKLKFFSAAILGLCLTFGPASTAFASSNNDQSVTFKVQSSDKEKLLLEKQSEIDKYVFEEHAKEIESKGIKVTHTGQANGYVEVGITPFTKANADYFYNLFGKDLIKVVEGQQAQLMNGAVTTSAQESASPVKETSVNYLVYAAILVAAAGGITFIVKKQRMER